MSLSTGLLLLIKICICHPLQSVYLFVLQALVNLGNKSSIVYCHHSEHLSFSLDFHLTTEFYHHIPRRPPYPYIRYCYEHHITMDALRVFDYERLSREQLQEELRRLEEHRRRRFETEPQMEARKTTVVRIQRPLGLLSQRI
jgi:hypothetical protein